MSTDSSSPLSPKTCCLCVPLKTGTTIIAVLSLVLGLIGIAFSIFQGVTGNAEGWVDLVIDLIHLFLASLLLHGVRTDRVLLVWLWVWGTGMLAALSIIVGVVIIALTDSIMGAILLFVVSAVQVYFIIVVRAYALQVTPSPASTQVAA